MEWRRERERDTRRRWRISPLSRSLFIFLSLLLAPSLARSLARSKRPFQFSAGTGVACQLAARCFLSANAMKCVSLFFFFLSYFFFSRLFLESICVRGLCVERLESRHEKFQVRDEMRRRPINDAFEFERNGRERERQRRRYEIVSSRGEMDIDGHGRCSRTIVFSNLEFRGDFERDERDLFEKLETIWRDLMNICARGIDCEKSWTIESNW